MTIFPTTHATWCPGRSWSPHHPIRRQDPHRAHRQRQPLPQRRPRRSRRRGRPHQHLPRRTLPAHRQTPRQTQSPRRRRPLHPHHHLAPARRPHRPLPRPRPRLPHHPHRQRPQSPQPHPPTASPRLHRHPCTPLFPVSCNTHPCGSSNFPDAAPPARAATRARSCPRGRAARRRWRRAACSGRGDSVDLRRHEHTGPTGPARAACRRPAVAVGERSPAPLSGRPSVAGGAAGKG
jgi:hypothetical protein